MTISPEFISAGFVGIALVSVIIIIWSLARWNDHCEPKDEHSPRILPHR